MKELPIFSGRIRDGRLMIDNRTAFDRFLTTLSGQVSLEIRQWSRRRSLDQNALIWQCNNIVSTYTGYSPNEIHEISKRHCLIPKYIRDPEGKMIEVYSTTLLEKGEVSDYLEQMENYWRKWNPEVSLPLGNKNLEVK